MGGPRADPRVPACMSAAERKWPRAVSMRKLRLESGLGQLAGTGPAFFLRLPFCVPGGLGANPRVEHAALLLGCPRSPATITVRPKRLLPRGGPLGPVVLRRLSAP